MPPALASIASGVNVPAHAPPFPFQVSVDGPWEEWSRGGDVGWYGTARRWRTCCEGSGEASGEWLAASSGVSNATAARENAAQLRLGFDAWAAESYHYPIG